MIKENNVDTIDNKLADEMKPANKEIQSSKNPVIESAINIDISAGKTEKPDDNFILVDLSKKGNTSTILSLIENKKKEKEKKPVKLDVNSNNGLLQNALRIAQAIHSCEVDLHIKVRGAVSLAETVLVSSGQIGYRSAEFGSTFTIGKHGKYGKKEKTEKKINANSLLPEDLRTRELLGKFTGKASLIGKFLLSGGILGTKQAKQANIIDNISEFKSKYLPEKTKSNRGRNSKVETDSVKEVFKTTETETVLDKVKVEEKIVEAKDINSLQEFTSAESKIDSDNEKSEKVTETIKDTKEIS